MVVINVGFAMLNFCAFRVFLFDRSQALVVNVGTILDALHTGTLDSVRLISLSKRIFHESDNLSLCRVWF